MCNVNSEQIISMSATSETPGGKIYLHLSFKKRHQSVNHESHGRVCVFICACAVNLRISLNVYCSSVHFDWWFFFPSFCRKGGNPTRFQAAYWRQTINHWQISMAEMRTRVPYLLGLPCEPASACASSPAAPLTLNYLAAVTTNQSNYRSRTVCSCSYCTASCISFEMYEVYILSLLFI